MKNNEVTERDIRLPEFRDAKLEDLEFREDGVIVRKDRWERGIRNIVGVFEDFAPEMGIRRGKFEVQDIVNEITKLVISKNKDKNHS